MADTRAPPAPKELVCLKPRSGNTTRGNAYKARCRHVDLSARTRILAVDRLSDGARAGPAVAVAHAECMVTMEQLVRHLLPLGLLPRVVAEFRAITVGGAIMGASLESTSFRAGQFHDACAWVQLRMADGSERLARRGDELWRGVSGSLGTLALCLAAGVECEPAAPFVRVRHTAFAPAADDAARAGGARALCAALHALTTAALAAEAAGAAPPAQFAEGLQFPPELVPGGGASLLTAEYLPDGAGGLRVWRARWWAPWWHERAGEACAAALARGAQRGGAHEEAVPTEDYVFRYDYGAFWMARPMACELGALVRGCVGLPTALLLLLSSRLLRPLLGALYGARTLFSALHAAPPAAVGRVLVVQDCYVPAPRAHELVGRVRAHEAGRGLSTPLWLCPVAPPAHRPQPLAPHDSAAQGAPEPRINVGVYGRLADGSAAACTRALERWTRELGGRKMLYAASARACPSDFWADYERRAYEELRARYGADGAFPDVCEKACAPLEHWTGALGALAERIATLVL